VILDIEKISVRYV